MSTLIDRKGKKEQVIGFFLEQPTQEIHLRALSRKLKISPTWITKIAKQLAKAGLLIIRKDKEKKIVILKASRDSLSFKRLKICFNLYRLHQCGFLDELIKTYVKPEAIILFGSYRRGEDTGKSDIDLAVLTARKINKDWGKFEKALKRKIKIKEIQKEKIEVEFMTTLANGFVLYGYLDIRK